MARRRRLSKWQVDRLAELQRMLDAELGAYIGLCHEAAERAPDWAGYWEAEAQYVEAVKSAIVHRIQDWIDHAMGKDVATMKAKGDADRG